MVEVKGPPSMLYSGAPSPETLIAEAEAGGGVEPERIFLLAPDAAGLARVSGWSGAAPAGALVFVEKLLPMGHAFARGSGCLMVVVGLYWLVAAA